MTGALTEEELELTACYLSHSINFFYQLLQKGSYVPFVELCLVSPDCYEQLGLGLGFVCN